MKLLKPKTPTSLQEINVITSVRENPPAEGQTLKKFQEEKEKQTHSLRTDC